MNSRTGLREDASDLRLAVQLANQASKMLLERQRTATNRSLTREQLKDEGDAQSQLLISAGLNRYRPTDAVLSEEAADSSARLHSDRVWIIDPLDGTREFAEGRPDWAVHVALWQGSELSVGAVALPGLGVVLDSSPEVAPATTQNGRIRIAVSRSRPPSIVGVLAESLDAELVPMGSAGYKACAVVRGEVDAYVHAGGQYEWDSAAPVVVARSRGLHASRIDGSPLAYNQRDPYLPDLLICRPDLAELLIMKLQVLSQKELLR
ncbi:3'(2'),5'-bisphosphate nucleotidase CysQ [Arthrobacter sp. H20]|uniref:3'(2'),5'-bisphosphate nucleotidase CysQ n=1 Tax=Arthrobacter sp. H20 TaxID=1267981 RepID=UPI000478B2C6|nr:3'(2'),5'-bisphosphate nucleotidase CysQ [Arthrobacter sp. H20]